jgi:hypothetical protein
MSRKSNTALAATVRRTLGIPTATPFVFLAIILLATPSCSRDAAFGKAYSSIDRSAGLDSLVSDLVRLDQEYPDRFKLKHEIGMLFLQKGDARSAEPFLKRAQALARRIHPSDQATLFGGLAIVAYAHGDYRQAADWGKKATAVKAREAAPFGFITARALLAQDKKKEALDCFDAAWEKAKASMAREDYRSYARTLESAGRYADLITVLDGFEASYPYEPGLGLMQSEAYERIGNFDGAVFAAFKEAEYGKAYGAAKSSDIQKNLVALGRRLDDKAFNPEGKGKSALQAVSAFAREDWAVALGILKDRTDPLTFEKYVLLSARIELKHATSADVDSFATLMPSLRSLPPYYYRLYLGLKDLADVGVDRLADVLETAINLAPGSGESRSYRTELANVLGLAPSDGSRILTKAEVSAAAEKSAASGETALLDPLVSVLELKDNRSTLLAVGILRAFAKDGRYRPYIIDKSKNSTGRTRERLGYILAN